MTGIRYIFTPPVEYANPTTIAAPHPGNRLFRHSHPRLTGVRNVYILPGNVVSTQETYGVRPLSTFHGGHICDVSADQAALLRAAGYTVLELPGTPIQIPADQPIGVPVPPSPTPVVVVPGPTPTPTPTPTATVPDAPKLAVSTATVPGYPTLTATVN